MSARALPVTALFAALIAATVAACSSKDGGGTTDGGTTDAATDGATDGSGDDTSTGSSGSSSGGEPSDGGSSAPPAEDAPAYGTGGCANIGTSCANSSDCCSGYCAQTVCSSHVGQP